MADHVWSQSARLVSAPAQSSPRHVHEEVMRLFGEMRTPLHRYLQGLGLPVADAEDVIQDVFLELFRHLRDGKPEDNLRAWVFRVGRNLALKRQQALGHFDPWVDDPDPRDAGANPEEQAVESQRQRTARAVVGALPALDRQCLLLRAEGLRYREIAAVLDISLGSVAASLSRTLARIARATQDEK